MLLVKLRRGLPLVVLSKLLGIKKDTCISARSSLMSDLVPKNIGQSHIERRKVGEDHTTDFAKSETDVAIALADGTY